MKIGHGYDAHRLIEGSGVILGGVAITCNYSIDAHSDGDLIVHALIDALLGAAGFGDIGTLYPSEDNKFKSILRTKSFCQIDRFIYHYPIRYLNTV